MTSRDDERPSDRPEEASPSTRRPGQRRAMAAAGVVGLAAVLGGGAYLTTTAIRGNNATTTLDAAAIGPATVATTVPDSPPASASAPASAAASASVTPPASSATPSVPPEVAKQIKEARENGKKYGVKVMHPVIPKTAAPLPSDIRESTTGSIEDGGVVRVISGHGDLTGQGELAYVAGGISKYRGNECTKTYKFATDLKPKKRQNMLMCWRITAQKSVAAIVIDYKGHPSKDKAAEVINAQWRRMG
jgi:hypothetical protein